MKELLLLLATIHVVRGQPGPPPPNFFNPPPPPDFMEQMIRNQQHMAQFPPQLIQAALFAENNGLQPFDFNRPGQDFPPGFQHRPLPNGFIPPPLAPPITQTPRLQQSNSNNEMKRIPIHFEESQVRPAPSIDKKPYLKPHKLDYLKKAEELLKEKQRVIFPSGKIPPVDTLHSEQFRNKLHKASDSKQKPSVLVIPLPRPKTSKKEEHDHQTESNTHRRQEPPVITRYTLKTTDFRPTQPTTYVKTPPSSTHSLYKPKFEYGFKPIGNDNEEESRHKLHSDGTVTRNRYSIPPPRQEKSRTYSSFLGKRPLPTSSSSSTRYREDDHYASESVQNNGIGKIPLNRENPTKPVVTLTFDCKGGKDLGWCVLGDRYPRSEVDHIVDECEEVIEAMYVDSTDEWRNYTLQARQRGNPGRSANPAGSWSWSDYEEEPLCNSDRKVIRPAFAKDVNGNWHVVIQTEKYVQKVPTSICRNADGPCNHLSNCGIRSKCIQKYSHRLLVSIDPSKPQECPGMRLYKFPSDCVCHSISNS